MVRLQQEFDIEVDWRGFELHPETPLGGRDISELFPNANIEARRRHTIEFAASFGVKLVRRKSLSNTRRALAMVEFARDQKKMEIFRDGVMDAYWLEGEDIEDDDTLARIAANSGLDADLAIKASTDAEYLKRVDLWRIEAGKEGITGIPTFFINDQRLVGCQPYQALADAARRAGASLRVMDQ